MTKTEPLVERLRKSPYMKALTAEACARIEELEAKSAALEQQAVQWKGEAMAHKSSLHEAYQVLTGATGEPGNWNGARPFRQFLQADRDEFHTWLRNWVHDRFDKWVTHRTVWNAYRDFDSSRRVRTLAKSEPTP